MPVIISPIYSCLSAVFVMRWFSGHYLKKRRKIYKIKFVLHFYSLWAVSWFIFLFSMQKTATIRLFRFLWPSFPIKWIVFTNPVAPFVEKNLPSLTSVHNAQRKILNSPVNQGHLFSFTEFCRCDPLVSTQWHWLLSSYNITLFRDISNWQNKHFFWKYLLYHM